MKINMKIKEKIDLFFVFGLFILSIVIKFYAISGNDILFIFDQARDAHISRQILESKDIKIIGPSASGTEDKLYHGVLYYYIIGPIYTLFYGNPYPVALILGIINSLAIISLFLSAKSFTQNTTSAIISAFLLATSFEAAQLSTWLSNPSLVLFSGGFFYYFLWQTFYNSKPNKFMPTMFFLGLCNQFFLFTIYLWAAIFLSFAYTKITKSSEIPIKTIIIGLFVYLLTISTMIVAQLIQFFNGVGTIQLNEAIGSRSIFLDFDKFIQQIISLYSHQLTSILFPRWPAVSIALFFIAFIQIIMKYSLRKKTFIIICLISPFLMLSLQPRTAAHTLVGTSIIFYLLITSGISLLANNKLSRLIICLLIGVYLFENFNSLKTAKENDHHIFSVQNKSMLKHSLETIDYTYQLAQGQEFTISTLTNPYLYNTTWAYLYHWYGLNQYGYLPKFFGPNQKGIPAGELLEQSQKPDSIHFSILEENIDLNETFKQQFINQQVDQAGKPTTEKNFTTILVKAYIYR